MSKKSSPFFETFVPFPFQIYKKKIEKPNKFFYLKCLPWNACEVENSWFVTSGNRKFFKRNLKKETLIEIFQSKS